MCGFDLLVLASLLYLSSASLWAAPSWHGLGRAVTAIELAGWDIDVRPDGTGLPPRSGSVADRQSVYDEKCASCHGTFGESDDYIALAGGVGSLASESPQRTVGSRLNYATTWWDYINRAMPFNNSKSLSVNEVYALTAYVLNLNELVPADTVLDQTSLPKVVMPNRDGFTLDHGMGSQTGRADVVNTACMQNCTTTGIKVTSELPAGFTAQMYGDIQAHFRHFDRPRLAAALTTATAVGLTLAQTNAASPAMTLTRRASAPHFLPSLHATSGMLRQQLPCVTRSARWQWCMGQRGHATSGSDP